MHALNVKFEETMRQFCEKKSGIGRYLVQDKNDRCNRFFDCNEEIVSQRDPNLLIESFRIKGPVCYVKISQEVSPTQVAVLSAFVANGRK